jgi:RNA polymerase sigma factor (sigma-70 family)
MLSVPTAEALPERHPGFLESVTTLVHAHRATLLRYGRRLGLDAQEALDAVQDTFVAFLALPAARAIAHQDEDSIKLLTVMLRHDAQNRRRKRSRRARAQILLEAEPAARAPLPSDELVKQAEDLVRVQCCVGKMAKLQQRVITLSLLEERPHENVAELLGISPGHVRVLLHRAREHVRTCPFEPLAESV